LPAVRAVVSYYGGATNSLNDYIEDLPPVLLIHGSADTVVPAARSQALYNALVSRGKTAELHIYPGMGHTFNFSGSRYDARAAADAQKRTLAFLGKYLNGSKD
jgi:carboxymethylenebutenolidase